MPDDNDKPAVVQAEKPAVVEAADALNDLVEEAALAVADAAIDPEHVAPLTNEQVYIPEATEAPPGVKGGKHAEDLTDQ
jgi:hypothetical protein